MKPLEYSDSAEEHLSEILDVISLELGNKLPPDNGNIKMAVIIPAMNESHSILKTLEALSNQKDFNNLIFDRSSFEILVLCHNCSDETYPKCIAFATDNPQINIRIIQLNSTVANTVGAARRILMNIACTRLKNPNGLIISTDADTIPQSDWLYSFQTYIEQKIGLVCGFIKADLNELKDQALIYLAAKDEYLLLRAKLESEIFPNLNDPWPRHNYHWGPNMAIKKYVYEEIGGIRPLHFLEDVDLYYRAVSNGHAIRHCLKCIVTTSTRTDSRCIEGFGAELRVWTEHHGVAYNVEGLDKLMVRFEIFKLLIEYYGLPSQKALKIISDLAKISIEDLIVMIEQSERSEALIISMEQHLNKSEEWNSDFQNIGVIDACRELSEYFVQDQKAVNY